MANPRTKNDEAKKIIAEAREKLANLGFLTFAPMEGVPRAKSLFFFLIAENQHDLQSGRAIISDGVIEAHINPQTFNVKVDFYVAEQIAHTIKPAKHGKKWTEEEDAKLSTLWCLPTTTINYLAKYFTRSAVSITARLEKTGSTASREAARNISREREISLPS
ncbi:hypothetical protein QN379_19580 [Glaciimonas sp. Gout2]|uniref:hypothetical protein n=1 Tax=unclassified Glaciimonas TaxID=2644401 RepID=UPI002B22E72F|nr:MULTISPECIES: hypothetical protein [unclassified Glaciimonas]MEB0014547.1 hypothetical protein [Glaciimonas sp. Cout2]MEB0084213.1 hypothetical protein [Glaciimonas sp. Gout2]